MLTKDHDITIVVPVYNRAKLVVRTLDSIYAQTHRPISLIIVDNNSSDDSAAIVSQWATEHNSTDFSVSVTSETHPGAAAARNHGLSLVDTPLVMFFDSDDTMRPGLVEQYLHHFNRHPDAEIIYTAAYTHDLKGNTYKLKITRHHPLRNHIYHSILKTAGYACHTSLIRRVGAWDTDMRGWDDWVLGIRLLLATDKAYFMPGTYIDIYSQVESITATDFSSRPRLWEDALDRADMIIDAANHRDQASLHRLIDYRRVILAAHYAREGAGQQAHDLYSAVINRPGQSRRMQLLMPLVYHYTRLGGRGAATIVNPLI